MSHTTPYQQMRALQREATNPEKRYSLEGVIALIEHETCENIIQTYYKEIYSYCFAKLSYKHHPAEERGSRIHLRPPL